MTQKKQFGRTMVSKAETTSTDGQNAFRIEMLEMHPIDFTAVSPRRWWFRRTIITCIVMGYCLMALAYLEQVVARNDFVPDRHVKENVAAKIKATLPPPPEPVVAVLGKPATGTVAAMAMSDAPPPAAKPKKPKDDGSGVVEEMHEAGQTPLIMMMVMGFLGSVFFLIRVLVRTRRDLDMPVMWYALRPFMGMLLAVFIYFSFRAGGLVFFTSADGAEDLNIYTLAILAITTGIFSEQAFERLHATAVSMLAVDKKDAESA